MPLNPVEKLATLLNVARCMQGAQNTQATITDITRTAPNCDHRGCRQDRRDVCDALRITLNRIGN